MADNSPATGKRPATREEIEDACGYQWDNHAPGDPGFADGRKLDWEYDPAYPVDRLDAPDAEWFHNEVKMAAEDGLNRDWDTMVDTPIREAIVVRENGNKGYIWDGYHRAGSSVTAGRATVPALVGRDKPKPQLTPATAKKKAARPLAMRRAHPLLDDNFAPNGQRVQRNFHRWFADSKVLDKKGWPLVVFHGTDEEITSFEQGIAYFSDDKDGAGRYGGTILSVYLKITNPYIHDDTLFNPSPEFIEELKAKGHDGIISAGEDEGERYFITFSPEQVKSATANNGNYDAENPSLTDEAPQPRARASRSPGL